MEKSRNFDSSLCLQGVSTITPGFSSLTKLFWKLFCVLWLRYIFFFHFWEFLNNYTGGYHGNISIAPPFQLPRWWVMGCQYHSAIVLNSITIATGSSVIFQMIRVFFFFFLLLMSWSDRSLFFPLSNACPRKKADPQAP